MRKPRARTTPGRTYTISCADDEWEAMRLGAKRADKPVAPWAVECALSVDFQPRKHRRLALDATQQRHVARSMAAYVHGLGAAGDPPSRFSEDLLALLAARVRALPRGKAEALPRETFGARRAEIVVAATMPKTEPAVEPAEKPGTERSRRTPVRRPLSDSDGDLPLLRYGDTPI